VCAQLACIHMLYGQTISVENLCWELGRDSARADNGITSCDMGYGGSVPPSAGQVFLLSPAMRAQGSACEAQLTNNIWLSGTNADGKATLRSRSSHRMCEQAPMQVRWSVNFLRSRHGTKRYTEPPNVLCIAQLLDLHLTMTFSKLSPPLNDGAIYRHIQTFKYRSCAKPTIWRVLVMSRN
jgi:hypothetical protein